MTQPKYTIRKLKQHETANGVAWTCEILKDGRLVGTCEQAGRGGCNSYYFTERAEQDAFAAHARTQVDTDFEPEDEYMLRLTSAFELSRKRGTVFVYDGDDFWETGQYRTFPASVSPERARQVLREQRDRNPRIWDKAAADFVPVD